MPDHTRNVQAAAEAAVISASTKVTGAGSAVSVAGWVTQSNLGFWIGILIGATGLVINWVYQHRRDKREQEHHALLLQRERQSILDCGDCPAEVGECGPQRRHQ